MELETILNEGIVKPQEEEETQYGSIVVPDLGKDRNEHGTVVAVGPGHQIPGIGFVEITSQSRRYSSITNYGFYKTST